MAQVQPHPDLANYAAEMLATAKQALILAGLNANDDENVATLAAALIVAAAQKD